MKRMGELCLVVMVGLCGLVTVMVLSTYLEYESAIASLELENARLKSTLEVTMGNLRTSLEGEEKRGRKPLAKVQIPPTPVAIVSSLQGKAKLMVYLAENSGKYTRPTCDIRGLYSRVNLLSSESTLSCDIKGLRSPTFGTGAYCWGTKLVLDPNRIKVSRGGEDVLSVMGRTDSEETANVSPGALLASSSLGLCTSLALQEHQSTLRHVPWLQNMLHSICPFDQQPPIGITKTEECNTWDNTLTLLVHRYEYANLYHTATELLAALTTVQHSALLRTNPHEPIRLIFLDGHAKGNLDDAWSWVFSRHALPTLRVGQLTSKLCLARVMFAEVGYSSEINLHPRDAEVFGGYHPQPLALVNQDWCVMPQAIELGNVMRALAPEIHSHHHSSKRVVFIARDAGPLPAHPRVSQNTHRGGEVERSMSDLNALQRKAVEMTSNELIVDVALLSSMKLAEQIKLLCQADVVISVHGAGLMHMMWASQALWIELAPASYQTRIHFPKVAARSGVRFVRLAELGRFLQMTSEQSSVTFTAEMLEQVTRWAVLPQDVQLANI
ncbi:hypothetical protein BASA81_003103 [Batrachochytrium salamandrivorans]|nr:hypothetical protein BASA81_003103 [Batrachochytrium salamandrivorans]